MPFRCYAVCHTLLQFRFIPHGSYCVLHATSFISPSLRYITPRSQLYNCFKAWHTFPTHKAFTQVMHMPSQTNATILTGFHFASLVLHSFGITQFTRCQYLCSPCLPATASGLSWFIVPAHIVLLKQKHTPNPCV